MTVAEGIVGKKCGMTRIFEPDGTSIPVTVVEATPNRVTQVKTEANDGYSAVQVTRGTRRASRVKKAQAGHYAKAGVEAGEGLYEFRLTKGQEEAVKPGEEITVDIFEEGQWVDVVGTTKGKGFAGAVKRHGFKMQDATHGNSLSHRALGSVGQCQDPGRVFKGKKMAGHMGNVRRTAESLKIVKIDKDRHLLFIKGAVPGAPNNNVFVLPAEKKEKPKRGES